jgi:hypothetical protein
MLSSFMHQFYVLPNILKMFNPPHPGAQQPLVGQGLLIIVVS